MNKSILVGLSVLAISTSAASAWTHHRSSRDGYRAYHSSASRVAPREAMNYRAYNNSYYGPGYARPGFWPADVAGATVGTAGAIAAGAVNTAGAIATAPFRPANPYAYYPAGSYAYYPANSYGYYPASYYGPGYARSGFWPADVAGATVGTAGAVAAGAVNTAGAIATAPFRPAHPYGRYPANSYAYYRANSYAMVPGGISSKDREMYVKNLHDSGYNPKNDFNKDGTMRQH